MPQRNHAALPDPRCGERAGCQETQRRRERRKTRECVTETRPSCVPCARRAQDRKVGGDTVARQASCCVKALQCFPGCGCKRRDQHVRPCDCEHRHRQKCPCGELRPIVSMQSAQGPKRPRVANIIRRALLRTCLRSDITNSAHTCIDSVDSRPDEADRSHRESPRHFHSSSGGQNGAGRGSPHGRLFSTPGAGISPVGARHSETTPAGGGRKGRCWPQAVLTQHLRTGPRLKIAPQDNSRRRYGEKRMRLRFSVQLPPRLHRQVRAASRLGLRRSGVWTLGPFGHPPGSRALHRSTSGPVDVADRYGSGHGTPCADAGPKVQPRGAFF